MVSSELRLVWPHYSVRPEAAVTVSFYRVAAGNERPDRGIGFLNGWIEKSCRLAYKDGRCCIIVRRIFGRLSLVRWLGMIGAVAREDRHAIGAVRRERCACRALPGGG
ncbi:protein of unknown function [Burkholderia multivorans]